MTTRWAYRVRVLKRYGYLLVFVIPALMPFAAWLASRTGRVDAAAWFPLFFLFVLLPLADYALGRDSANPVDAADIERLEGDRWFRWLTLACVPVQLALVAWSTWMFVMLPFSWIGASPRLMRSTLAWSTSTQTQSWPISEKHAPETMPT